MTADAEPLSFDLLRERALSLLQRIAPDWTDHNAHDPGITILEQVCYALTDLDYRTRYSMADLLASGGKHPYASVYTPAQILPSGPVTRDDLRKIVLDVRGVKNAWIDSAHDRMATHDTVSGEVRVVPPRTDRTEVAGVSPNVSDITPAGLYRVWIEKSDLMDIDGGTIIREAARRLHRSRPLGEDFLSIDVLDVQPVRLDMAVEIAPVGDATDLLAAVYERVSMYCSPTIRFHSLDEMLALGRRVDAIFEGPLLEHGFLDPAELAAAERRTTLRVSDLIHEVTAIPGVIAVKQLRFQVNGQVSPDWLLTVDEGRAARFDAKGSSLRLERGMLRVDSDALRAAALDRFLARARERVAAPRPGIDRDLTLPVGRDRDVGRYVSIQHQFPMAYGIGPAGLPRSAPPERRAAARQLQAYLLFYDQLLANYFAQLAHCGSLLSFHDDSMTSYFATPVPDDDDVPIGFDALRVKPASHEATLRRITEETGTGVEGAEAGLARRNRMLDHLLARVGEQFSDYALLQFGREVEGGVPAAALVANDKRAFLRDYPRIGRDRGLGADYLSPPSLGEAKFVPGDCIDPGALVGRWSAVAPDAMSAELWGLCSASDRALLTSPDTTRPALEAIVLDALNRSTRPRLEIEAAYPELLLPGDDPENVSGLELALRRKLGVRTREERFYLVEHILLRPMPGDAAQQGPLMRASARRDPYSLQVTLVFPSWPARYQDRNFQQFVEETVREQAPAHLAAWIRWLDRKDMQAFEAAYGSWMRRWRNHRRAELGL